MKNEFLDYLNSCKTEQEKDSLETEKIIKQFGGVYQNNALLIGKSDNIILTVKKWCAQNEVLFINIDANEVKVIDKCDPFQNVDRNTISTFSFINDLIHPKAPFILSKALEDTVSNNKCFILISNLFSLNEAVALKVCEKFVCLRENPFHDNSKVICCAVIWDKEKEEKIPPDILHDGLFTFFFENF